MSLLLLLLKRHGKEINKKHVHVAVVWSVWEVFVSRTACVSDFLAACCCGDGDGRAHCTARGFLGFTFTSSPVTTCWSIQVHSQASSSLCVQSRTVSCGQSTLTFKQL